MLDHVRPLDPPLSDLPCNCPPRRTHGQPSQGRDALAALRRQLAHGGLRAEEAGHRHTSCACMRPGWANPADADLQLVSPCRRLSDLAQSWPAHFGARFRKDRRLQSDPADRPRGAEPLKTAASGVAGAREGPPKEPLTVPPVRLGLAKPWSRRSLGNGGTRTKRRPGGRGRCKHNTNTIQSRHVWCSTGLPTLVAPSDRRNNGPRFSPNGMLRGCAQRRLA